MIKANSAWNTEIDKLLAHKKKVHLKRVSISHIATTATIAKPPKSIKTKWGLQLRKKKVKTALLLAGIPSTFCFHLTFLYHSATALA